MFLFKSCLQDQPYSTNWRSSPEGLGIRAPTFHWPFSTAGLTALRDAGEAAELQGYSLESYYSLGRPPSFHLLRESPSLPGNPEDRAAAAYVRRLDPARPP